MIDNITKTDRIYCEVQTTRLEWSDEKRNSLRKELSIKYGVPIYHIDVQPHFMEVGEDGQRLSLTQNIITDIQNPKFQTGLFEEYLKLAEINDVSMDDINSIDELVNSFVDFDLYSKYKRYKFKHLKWSNYCSYGPDNYFDFTKLNGLVLLNGKPENQCGKTTFAIDLLRFTLFGSSSKSPNLADVFNEYLPEATEVMCEACIEIDGEDYVIRRTVKRPALSKRTAKSKCTQTIEYFKYINGSYEETENKTGDNNNETKKFITEAIGKVEDYDLVISATTRSLGNILEMGQADKTRLFSKWMGLSMLEEKEGIAKKLFKERIESTFKSKLFNKATLNDEIESYKIVNKDCAEKIKVSKKKIKECDKRLKALDEEKNNLYGKKKEIKEELTNIDVTTLQAKIDLLINNYKVKKAQFTENKSYIDSNKGVEFNSEARKKCQTSINLLNEKIGTLRGEAMSLQKDIQHVRELIAEGVCPTCKHPIDVDEQSVFIEEKQKLLDGKIEEGKAAKEELNRLTTAIEQMDANKGIVDEVTRRSIKNDALSAEMENITTQGTELRRQQTEINDNAENIRTNNIIDADIRNVDVNIASENSIKDGLNREINECTVSIKTYETEIEKRKALIIELEEEEKKRRNWEVYKLLVSREGIVKLVLKRALPILNSEVNRYLSGLCDFMNEICIDENGNVSMNLVKDGHKLNLANAASGFESVMSALSIRTALASVSSLPLPSFICLDEILDGVAVSNYDNVRELFNRIAENYDFIIHISHNELISDWHNQFISVVKNEQNVSKIELAC